MTDPSSFRGYSLLIEVGATHIPSSGYFDITDLPSIIVHQFQLYGHGLPPADITELTKWLITWADDPVKPWTFTHHDMTATVRLTQRFQGFGSDGKPL